MLNFAFVLLLTAAVLGLVLIATCFFSEDGFTEYGVGCAALCGSVCGWLAAASTRRGSLAKGVVNGSSGATRSRDDTNFASERQVARGRGGG